MRSNKLMEVSTIKGEIRNTKITGTSLTMADHGCITFWVHLEGGGIGVSYGGYCIGHGYLGSDNFDGSGKGLEAMARIMNVVGVDTWEDMKGKYVRIVDPGLGGTVTKIGNILEDRWFDIREFFADSNE